MQTEKPIETPRPPLSNSELLKEIEHLTNEELTAKIKIYEKNLTSMNVEQKSLNNKLAEQARKTEGNNKRIT